MMVCSLSSWAQTATDNYLDIANYATMEGNYTKFSLSNIGNVQYLNLYKYEEYPDDGVAWLTMPVYLAARSAGSQNNQNLNWITVSANAIYAWSNTGDLRKWFSGTNIPIGTNPHRSATNPFWGSNEYFGTGGAYRYGNADNGEWVAFYVTNVTQVQMYVNWFALKTDSENGGVQIEIYQCKSATDLTLYNLTDQQFYHGTKAGNDTYSSGNKLDANKVYKVVCTCKKGCVSEIAFRTPINNTTIDATPTSLDFETRVGTGTPVTKTFHVSGTNLTEPITATLSDQNGVFSLSTTSVSVADGTAGTDITVTFDPQEFGTYNGTITLSSGNAEDVVINLIGNAIDGYDLVISSAGLSTLYLDYPVSIPYETYDPDLLGVFYIYGIGSDTNERELLAGRFNNIIPAETGVIVQGNLNTPETPYFFPRISDEEAATYNENSITRISLLRGRTTPILTDSVETETEKVYTLGRGKDSYINFYHYTGTTLAANKAFLLVDAGNNVKSFTVRFDGDATGINTVDANNVDGAWYNLQGIRMQGEPTSKGVFIRNGKKYIIK